MRSLLLRFRRRRCSRLSCFCLFSLSPLPLLLCLFEERKIRLTGHTPRLARFFRSVFFLFCPLAARFPTRFGCASFWRFWAAFLGPMALGFLVLALRPFSGRLSAGRSVPSFSFVVFVFPVCCVCGSSHTRGADPSLHVTYPTGHRARPSGE